MKLVERHRERENVRAVIEPPAMFTGTLALTAVWLAWACDSAACSVLANCADSCA